VAKKGESKLQQKLKGFLRNKAIKMFYNAQVDKDKKKIKISDHLIKAMSLKINQFEDDINKAKIKAKKDML
jgi:hypothetical protein